MTAAELIERHRLEPHPEGGWYREIFRADDSVASPVHGGKRSAFTHIYFLLERGQVSRWHRVLHGEIWNFYVGAPLRLITFGDDVGQLTDVQLGGGDDNSDFVSVVAPGHWQAAESTGEFSLVGCTVAPGFDFADFRFLGEGDNEIIEALSRVAPELARFV